MISKALKEVVEIFSFNSYYKNIKYNYSEKNYRCDENGIYIEDPRGYAGDFILIQKRKNDYQFFTNTVVPKIFEKLNYIFKNIEQDKTIYYEIFKKNKKIYLRKIDTSNSSSTIKELKENTWITIH